MSFILTLANLLSIAAAASGWLKLSDGPWSAREGLMVVEDASGIVMVGGRANLGLAAQHDVWRTPNGSSWERLPDAPFAGRAYHAMLSHGACIFVMGGQTVALLGDPFFNDVWRSCDGGETWDSLGHAPWQPRAGLAFATHNGRMVVAGGCFGSSIGAGRKFLNDVWATRDGASWELLTANASWSARSGPRLVDFNGRLLLLAGEVGFTADTQLGDIWESDDGATWTLLTATPAFSARSGHGVVNAGGSLLLIAGWHDAKCLHDQWLSEDGVVWRMVSNATWACTADACGRFDFWPVATSSGLLLTLGGSNAYSTFGKLWAETWALPLLGGGRPLRGGSVAMH